MNINFTNLVQARAAARLKHNIKRLNRHEGKTATMKASGADMSVRIDFPNGTSIGESFKADELERISNFCDFLEGSEAEGIAALSEVSA